MKFTMNNIRKMKPWSDEELYAYGAACSQYSTQCESCTNKKPKFKALFNQELAKIQQKKFSKKNKTE